MYNEQASERYSHPVSLTLNMFAYFLALATPRCTAHLPTAPSVIPRRPISRVFEHILDEKISQSRSRPSFNVNFCGLWPSQ